MLLHLEGFRSGTELDAVLAVLDLTELPSVGSTGGGGGAWLLCPGPSIWHLVVDPQTAVPPALTLAGAAGLAFDAALDMSHAYTRIEIAGRNAEELIAKGCSLDLHPRMFPPGACAATGFTGMRTILWRVPDSERFELFVGRSHAVSLWEWLLEAAAEYSETPGAAPIGD
jgi:heterotetrameric sarcosine oxidase gamma subunit